MKAIMVKNKIISLENVKEVRIVNHSINKKPSIRVIVDYMGGENSSLPATSEEEAQMQLKQVFDILTKEKNLETPWQKKVPVI